MLVLSYTGLLFWQSRLGADCSNTNAHISRLVKTGEAAKVQIVVLAVVKPQTVRA